MIPPRAYLLPVLVAVALIAFGLKAKADDPTKEARWTCWTVRRALKIYKAEDLEQMARAAGVPKSEIERARRCLDVRK